MIYSKWKPHMHPAIELVPIELAGRGARYGEHFYADMSEAAEDVCRLIIAHRKTRPEVGMTALFGHSMGSTLAFETCRLLAVAGNGLAPSQLFCSGRIAPHIKSKRKRIHGLSDEQFQEEILQLGATPAAIFREQALLEMYMPILRADYTMIELYEYREGGPELSCDLTVLHGIDEDAAVEDLEGWRFHTGGRFRRMCFSGGHFYINDHMQQIVEWLNRTLLREVQLSARIYARDDR